MKIFHSSSQKFFQSGQAGLVILLLTIIVLTIGIAVATRTTVDVKLSRQEEESNRVFNAAESKVEELLSQDLGALPAAGSQTLPADNIEVNYTIDQLNTLETQVDEGKVAYVDVVGFNNNLRIRWSTVADCAENPASLMVMVFSQDSATSEISSRTEGYKICNDIDHGENFTQATVLGGGNQYRGQVIFNIQADDVFVLLQPLFNQTDIQVEGLGPNFPIQMYRVQSTAQSTIGGETRAVEVNKAKSIPSIFTYALFSGSSIEK